MFWHYINWRLSYSRRAHTLTLLIIDNTLTIDLSQLEVTCPHLAYRPYNIESLSNILINILGHCICTSITPRGGRTINIASKPGKRDIVKLEPVGIEPGTSRFQSGRSTIAPQLPLHAGIKYDITHLACAFFEHQTTFEFLAIFWNFVIML